MFNFFGRKKHGTESSPGQANGAPVTISDEELAKSLDLKTSQILDTQGQREIEYKRRLSEADDLVRVLTGDTHPLVAALKRRLRATNTYIQLCPYRQRSDDCFYDLRFNARGIYAMELHKSGSDFKPFTSGLPELIVHSGLTSAAALATLREAALKLPREEVPPAPAPQLDSLQINAEDRFPSSKGPE
ncbi:MAG: hypothetical protein K1X83_03615 [Oligoflexia bacterium]|nr:hypothetical protein [Oligoflexia bacterium]